MYDLQAEYASLAQEADLDWEKIEGKTFFITGATGLIGSSCIRLLMERNRAFHAGIKVIGLVRNLDKAKAILGEYSEADGLEYLVGDLLDFDSEGLNPHYIIHAGCPTVSKYFMEHPAETLRTIICGTRRTLNVARNSKAVLEGYVFVSSMEVYGDGNKTPGLDHILTEADLGYVNPLSVRSCYPEGKRAAEAFTSSYAREFSLPAKVARLAQTFGPGIPLNDTRIFAQMARCAIEGQDIILKTTGASTRMYNYITDAVVGLFTILLRGEPGAAYNVANENTYSSIREMGEMVAHECAHDRIEVKIDLDPNVPYPPEHHLPLDTKALKNLGWTAQVDLPEMYRRLIAYLKQ
ncbi:MAG: NAD-dependent epimerase/dehydratase family protein [Eggerthellaceae bacterium]|jgi:UDP-glucuronate decarboxylase